MWEPHALERRSLPAVAAALRCRVFHANGVVSLHPVKGCGPSAVAAARRCRGFLRPAEVRAHLGDGPGGEALVKG